MKSKLHKEIYEYIGKAKFRKEDTICWHFINKEMTGWSEVEDILFDLVNSGHIEWFGPDGGELRYRVLRKN